MIDPGEGSSDPTNASDVCITDELRRRRVRRINPARENAAFRGILREMAGGDSCSVLQSLTSTARDLCGASSAGISLLENDVEGHTSFRWIVIEGLLAPCLGGSVPRDESPWGMTLDRDTPQLFRHTARRYPSFSAMDPPTVEALVVPFRRRTDGIALGTLWIVAPDETTRFDSGHARVLKDLAGLVAVAFSARQSQLDHQRFDVAFADSSVGLSFSDPQLRIMGANRAFCRMTGYTEEELLATDILSITHPEDRKRNGELIRQMLAGETPGFAIEKRYCKRDGSVVWVQSSVSVMRDEAGRPVKVTTLSEDITARKTAEQQWSDSLGRERRALAEAQRANSGKDEFLAMLGHELRNPLSPIVTALQLMRMRGANCERERQVIERQVGYLSRMVDDLLDVSRIARGKIVIKKFRLELADAVYQAIETASPIIDQRQHTLELSVPAQGLPVEGDLIRLAQVVANLLTNAAKYTEPRGRIQIEATREGDVLALRVRDNGVGIAPDMLPHVFDSFTQVHQDFDRAQGGLGLGLAIVRNLVELHGGTVHAYSAGRNQGSEFVVRLPAARVAVNDHGRGNRGAVHHDVPDDRKTRRVLVVDDNVDAADLLVEVLSVAGHVVRVAYDGPSALSLVDAFHPDVALLDLGLPCMDGFELAQRLRELPSLAGIHLVAVTGYGQESDRQRTQTAGFEEHLVKPVDFDRLTSVIEGFSLLS